MRLLCNIEIALLVKNESDFHFFAALGYVSLLQPLIPALGYKAFCLHCLWGLSPHLSAWDLQYRSPHPGLRRAPKWLCYLPFLPFVNLCTNDQSDNLSTFFTTAGTELLEKKRSAKPGHTVCCTRLKMAQAGLTSGTSMSC